MCGDGANDCGALKAANVGISLSEAESSVASPFTSKTPNISCVPEVIREGRAALTTSFGIFKFMIAYSLIEYTSVLILYNIDSNLTDLQFLFIDICLIVFFASLFGKTKSQPGRLHPVPPMTSLLNAVPLTSLLFQILSAIAFQTLAYFIIQTFNWFYPFEYVTDSLDYSCFENYAVFSVSLFQYIAIAVIFSKGKPYRKPLYTNYYFTAALILMTAICIYIVYYPADWVVNALELKMPLEDNGKYSMLAIAAVHFVLAYMLEEFFVDFVLAKKVKAWWRRKHSSKSKKYLEVEKIVADDLRWQKSSIVGGFDNIAFNYDNEK